jgi:hypothetical protein
MWAWGKWCEIINIRDRSSIIERILTNSHPNDDVALPVTSAASLVYVDVHQHSKN